jgi:hypothetical protein
MKRSFRLALLVLVTAQFGCGPKLADVLKKYEGDFRTRRVKLQEIARSLPPKGSLIGEQPCQSLDPPLLFDEPGRRFNTEILMFDQLEDPDAKPAFDLLFSGVLRHALIWTGPKPKDSLSPSTRGIDIEKQLKDALACRYLVVNRVANLVEPIAVDEQRYSPGRAKIELFVVDLPGKAVLCSFVFEATSAEKVAYTYYKNTDSKEDRLARFARSSLWQDARLKMLAGLKRLSNGEIKAQP